MNSPLQDCNYEIDDRTLRKLAAAVLIQAVRDARGTQKEARADALAWLLAEGELWLYALGLDRSGPWLQEWIADGCPGQRSQHKPYIRKKGI